MRIYEGGKGGKELQPLSSRRLWTLRTVTLSSKHCTRPRKSRGDHIVRLKATTDAKFEELMTLLHSYSAEGVSGARKPASGRQYLLSPRPC